MTYSAVHFCLLACFLRKQISKLRGALEASGKNTAYSYHQYICISKLSNVQLDLLTFRMLSPQSSKQCLFITYAINDVSKLYHQVQQKRTL